MKYYVSWLPIPGEIGANDNWRGPSLKIYKGDNAFLQIKELSYMVQKVALFLCSTGSDGVKVVGEVSKEVDWLKEGQQVKLDNIKFSTPIEIRCLTCKKFH